LTVSHELWVLYLPASIVLCLFKCQFDNLAYHNYQSLNFHLFMHLISSGVWPLHLRVLGWWLDALSFFLKHARDLCVIALRERERGHNGLCGFWGIVAFCGARGTPRL
jgi:hypothetical protein